MSKKRRTGKIAVVILIVLLIIGSGLVLVPNPLSKRAVAIAKANGYMAYKPMEAYNLAHFICTQCHELERIKRYCPRCGPPFVALVPHMQSFMENYKVSKPKMHLTNITEDQAVAIVQVWNATVGNWEGDFREKDIKKLVGSYHKLFNLYKTPVDQRPIESALMSRSDLKMRYKVQDNKPLPDSPMDMRKMNMSEMEKSQMNEQNHQGHMHDGSSHEHPANKK